MNFSTIKNCYKEWAKLLPNPPTNDEIELWNLEQLTDKLHTSYISYILMYDNGAMEDRRFEKAYLRLWSLIKEYNEEQLKNENTGDMEDMKNELTKIIEKLEKKSEGYNPFAYKLDNWYSPLKLATYSPMTDYKYNMSYESSNK